MTLNDLISLQDYDTYTLALEDFRATVKSALLDHNDPLWEQLPQLGDGHSQVAATIATELDNIEDWDDLAYIVRKFDYPALKPFFGNTLAQIDDHLTDVGYYDDSYDDYHYDRATGN